MLNKLALLCFPLMISDVYYSQEITITIGYPDNSDYFIYSIPPATEQAVFGGEYYLKIKNTGTVPLTNWKIHTFWKALNSTWGVVTKTTIDAASGEIELTGPSWNLDLPVGDSIVLSGEWVPTGSIEDWIDFLPRESTCTYNNGQSVTVNYDEYGYLEHNGLPIQKTKPFSESRKTFATKKIIAYFPIYDAETAWCSLQRYGDNIDELRVQLYSISEQGVLRAGQNIPVGIDPVLQRDYWYDYINNMGVIDFCVNHGIQIVPVIYNYNDELGDFDQSAVHLMLTNSGIKQSHINDINSLFQTHSEFAGVDIDYESLLGSDRDAYSTFMEELSSQIHTSGKILTTAVHTKVGPGTWYGPQAQDYERIGNAVDEMLLMTYDLHWSTSPTYSDPPPTAGCQSTPDWMNDIACFVITEIDNPSKIQLGLPFYGYRWKEGFEQHTADDPGVGLTNVDAMELINTYQISQNQISREDHGAEPNFTVNLNGQNWVCYFQDSTSLDYKISSSFNEYDLKDYIGGIGIWRLGGENDAMWKSVVYNTKGTTAIIDTSFNCNEIQPLSVSQQELNFTIFPNPASEFLTIKNLDKTIEIKKIQIFSMDGILVRDYDISASDVTLSLIGIPNGIYTMKMSGLTEVTRKLVIKR